MKHRILLSGLAAMMTTSSASVVAEDRIKTATPIKHLVVIFQENVSFDHYFGAYPTALNDAGETRFAVLETTPISVNNLLTPLDVNNGFAPLEGVDLIGKNPNGPLGSGAAINGSDASNPFRLSPMKARTSSQDHEDLAEQLADDDGKMDAFPSSTGRGDASKGFGKNIVMGYYDGNTVTALWNYARRFAMNDNSWTTTFGPSTPGALNLISGQTNGVDATRNVVDGSGKLLHPRNETPDGNGNYTVIGDADPLLDICSRSSADQVTMHGPNIGDLLNAKDISWGSFMGGFDLTATNPNGTSGCQRSSATRAPGASQAATLDYIPHHAWFQYYASTRNIAHQRPKSTAAIGHARDPITGEIDPANHAYDIHDFFDALGAGDLPAVSFLKAPAYQDGHPGYSNPIDEQNFIVSVLNALQKHDQWSNTAVVIAYDDSDGWYDHQMPPIVNPSFTSADALNGPGVCQRGAQQGFPVATVPLDGAFGRPAQGRCGYGTRVPLLVISRFAKSNFVDHTLTDQSSVLRFIEDNWLAGQRIQPKGSFDTIAGRLNNMFDFDRRENDKSRDLFLDPATGAVVATP
ncbi:MAG: alkaline phosphatase family protein [Methylocystis sp.]